MHKVILREGNFRTRLATFYDSVSRPIGFMEGYSTNFLKKSENLNPGCFGSKIDDRLAKLSWKVNSIFTW